MPLSSNQKWRAARKALAQQLDAPKTCLPPTFLIPALQPRVARQSLFTRRWTSFWSHSYPDDKPSTSQIPYTPPSPTSRPAASAASPKARFEDGRRTERKQRYLDSLMDKAGELNLRCSVLDAEGNWTAQEGRYNKAELCKEYDLDPRDLRKLDSLSPNLVPLILTRRTCILISILHVRALIKPDRVIIFDTAGTVESEVQKRFKWHLERNIKAGLKARECNEIAEDGEEIGLPYEHRALESILVATANALEEEMAFTRSLVTQLLADLEDDINRDNLKRLLHYSRRMVGFQSRARYVKRAVDEILDNDEDLSAMYLTSTAKGHPRALHDHVQLELLLESFTKQVEEIVSEVDTTVANMQSTQEIAELMLDSGRNALLAMDIKISILTLGVGTGALVAGVFGMNLTSNLETTPFAFFIATGSAATLAILIWIYGYRVLRRVRRVALSDRSSTRRHVIWEDSISNLPTIDPLTGQQRPSTPFTLSIRSAPQPNSLVQRFFGWGGRKQQHAARVMQIPAYRTISKVSSSDASTRSRAAPMPTRNTINQEPVWINPQADVARARDAWSAQMQEREREAEVSGQYALTGAPGGGGVSDVGLGGARGGDMWEIAAWKWGRGKARRSKD